MVALAVTVGACWASPSATTVDGDTAPTESTTPHADSTADTSIPSTTNPVVRSEPVEGWGRLEVGPDVFGPVTLVGGATIDGRWILAGCGRSDTIDLGIPMWWSDDTVAWQQAESAADVGCISQVEATPFGLFALSSRRGAVLRSEHGEGWVELELHDDFGYQEPFQLGSARAIFVSPDDDRVTVLFSRASLNESTEATLVSTTDGATWHRGPQASAQLFDSSTVASVIEGGPGLIAVGASPGGEFVPSAAVFTSPDGLEWTRVTPRDPDFDGKVMVDVLAVPGGYIAVGGDFEDTDLMTAWTSREAVNWARSPYPEEPSHEFGFMTAEVVTSAGGSFWASGRDFDAARPGVQEFPALWRSDDGVIWQRTDIAELPVVVPFVLVETADFRLGVWPPPSSLIQEPPALFGSD